MDKGREILNFNTDWLFKTGDIAEAQCRDFDDSDFETIDLPHSNKEFPHHYFDEREYQIISWYRRHFSMDKAYAGKRVFVDFEGVMTVAEVFVNGKSVGEHKGGYTSFSFDITDYLTFGTESNVISVKVDSTRQQNVPPEGNIVDYMLFGGMYRNVKLRLMNTCHIHDIFVWTDSIAEDSAVLKNQGTVYNTSDSKKELTLMLHLLDREGNVKLSTKYEKSLAEGEKWELAEDMLVAAPSLWDIDEPYLYTMRGSLYENGELLDMLDRSIGIRTAVFREDGRFYLNNRPLKLRGMNRHQTFPYVGGAMPDRVQRKDADILKYDLGLNYVRASHYPQSPAFLDRCDEIGLLVLEEIPGWQYVSDNEEWRGIVLQNTYEMILRDRNHPSIFLWGVRINESNDDTELYTETNRIAHELDCSRQTTGTRRADCRLSEKLEDVFSYNDFIYDLEGNIHGPNHSKYLITEYLGHMFPTKRYDPMDRLIRHARLHALIQDKQYGDHGIAGASGWCAFDYNTTSTFGSGDRICYHGVCDIFRLPKLAGWFYKSQMEPEKELVVFIARQLNPSFFEEAGDTIMVFSNCDEMELFLGDRPIGIQEPNREDFPSLPHPPFEFKLSEYGLKFEDIQFTGVNVMRHLTLTAKGMIGGKVVKEQTLHTYGRLDRVHVQADDTELIADGADCTRVVISLLDENGSVLPMGSMPVSFTIEGPGRIVGENPICPEGGMAAMYVKALKASGEITLRAKVQGIAESQLTIRVLPMEEKTVPVSIR